MPLPEQFSLVVLGQGSTGLDVARWGADHLGERVSSVTVVGGAKSAPTPTTAELESRGVRFVFGTEEVSGSFDVCVTSPGISEFSDFFAAGRAASAQIMGEPEFAYRLSPDRWIAVTGTNGKTTTTSLVDHLLRSSGIASHAVGNIGEPPIHEVDGRAPGSWFAAELSSYQIATTSELHPRAAALLNITPDHLAWHRTHEAYARAKIRLFQNMDEHDLCVVNVDDPGTMAFADEIFLPGRRFCRLGLADAGTTDAAFVRDGMLVVRLGGAEHELVRTNELILKGSHNWLNALAAAVLVLFCGATDDGVRAGLRNFKPLEHRVEPCGEIDGVRFVNDSKATNTDAVEKALTAFPDDRVVLLLGGHDKGTPLEGFVSRVVPQVGAIVCFGDARERFRRAVEDAPGADAIDIAEANDLEDAVQVGRSLAHPGDVVLLSPACSSFDEFSGFEERGRVFKAIVAGMKDNDGE